jgi:protein-disulfide isomerase
VQRKEAARAARLAAEAAERRRSARRRALVRLGAVSALALAIVVAAVAVSASGDDPATAAPAAPSPVFADIPQEGISLGSPSAPVVLTEFADLQCPYCATYARDVLPAIVDRYVRTGKLRLELRVRSFLGEDSVRAAAMAAAAAKQNRLWQFADAFYGAQGQENSGYVTDDFLREVGAASGLDTERAFADRERPFATRAIEDAERTADAVGSTHTPDFYLRHGDGPLEPLPLQDLTPEAFAAALDRALR